MQKQKFNTEADIPSFYTVVPQLPTPAYFKPLVPLNQVKNISHKENVE